MGSIQITEWKGSNTSLNQKVAGNKSTSKGFSQSDKDYIKEHGGFIYGSQEAPTGFISDSNAFVKSNQQKESGFVPKANIALNKNGFVSDTIDPSFNKGGFVPTSVVANKNAFVSDSMDPNFNKGNVAITPSPSSAIINLSPSDYKLEKRIAELDKQYKIETTPGHFTYAWGKTYEEAKDITYKEWKDRDSKKLADFTGTLIEETGKIQSRIPGVKTIAEYTDYVKKHGVIGIYNVETTNGIKSYMAINPSQALRLAGNIAVGTSPTLKEVKVITPKIERELKDYASKALNVSWNKNKFEVGIMLGQIPANAVYAGRGTTNPTGKGWALPNPGNSPISDIPDSLNFASLAGVRSEPSIDPGINQKVLKQHEEEFKQTGHITSNPLTNNPLIKNYNPVTSNRTPSAQADKKLIEKIQEENPLMGNSYVNWNRLPSLHLYSL